MTKAIVIICSWGGVILVALLGLLVANAYGERDRWRDAYKIVADQATECQLRELSHR